MRIFGALLVCFCTMIACAMQAIPGFALNGNDPVELCAGQEIQGTSNYSFAYEGFQYQFKNAENLAKFKADPARFSIQRKGIAIENEILPGDPEFWVVLGGKIYLCGARFSQQQILADPDRLFDKATGKRIPQGRKTVAILVFPNVQIIDYTGPYEVFGAAGFEVVLVTKTKDQIRTAMGMVVTPHYSFADCPKVDIFLVPGGGGSTQGQPGVGGVLDDTTSLEFVKTKLEQSEYTMSVCNGAFILNKLGVLDGKEVTTFAPGLSLFSRINPSVKPRYDARYIDHGKLIMTAGLSSGIDGALHLVSKINGLGAAQRVALGIEYQWDPNSKYARANLADQVIRNGVNTGFTFKGTGTWTIDFERGDTEYWERGNSIYYEGITLADVHGVMVTKLQGLWKLTGQKESDTQHSSNWSMTDTRGQRWVGVVTVTKQPKDTDPYNILIRVDKVK